MDGKNGPKRESCEFHSSTQLWGICGGWWGKRDTRHLFLIFFYLWAAMCFVAMPDSHVLSRNSRKPPLFECLNLPKRQSCCTAARTCEKTRLAAEPRVSEKSRRAFGLLDFDRSAPPTTTGTEEIADILSLDVRAGIFRLPDADRCNYVRGTASLKRTENGWGGGDEALLRSMCWDFRPEAALACLSVCSCAVVAGAVASGALVRMINLRDPYGVCLFLPSTPSANNMEQMPARVLGQIQ
ncbi:hypothetical protein B0T25DRAFT_277582 [Lasiosphaeria hispida]|uniref:Uncharacterized protein n=1 Tax=Lasiosphaeria hispida TaxID=260671 RepID=A0AAJ0MAN0_9PEZI|nr:hypothetical protein B0T25DRAFT_277582 [Lasiosphaeria hispida]